MSPHMALTTNPQSSLGLVFESKENGSHLMADDAVVSVEAESSIPSHPLGIKPLGNKYFHDGRDAREFLGNLQVLPDELLAQLFEFLDPRSLRLLGYTCRFLFAFCLSDDLWKTIFLE